MPIPEPGPTENRQQFISRCARILATEDPNTPQQQRLAICFSQWRRQEDIHPSFHRVKCLFELRYGPDLGAQKYINFLDMNGLRQDQPYGRIFQPFREAVDEDIAEAFDWAKPHISFLRSDSNAKYYTVKAIHAIVSMNNKDYTDYPEMMAAAKSMNYRPVNLNHNHKEWFPYPRTRLDYAKAEDFTVEGILRVDNADKRLQQMLDHDVAIPKKEWIHHASIEGRPDLGGMENGYHFTGISLLQVGYKLPGDPLSEIMPLFKESAEVGGACLFIDGERVCLPCLEEESGELGSIELSESQDNKEASGPINPEGALCPQCGHKITPDPTIEATAISCPRCETTMVRLPEKAVEAIKDLGEEESLAYMLEHKAELKELFRPPFPFTPNNKFNKTEGSKLKDTMLPSIDGAIKGEKIGLVEAKKEIADLTDKLLEATKSGERKDAEISGLREDVAAGNEKISTLEKENAKTTGMKAQVAEKSEELVDEQTSHAETKGKLTEALVQVETRNKRIGRMEEELQKHASEEGRLSALLDDTRAKLNEALEKSATNTQKAINETKERSRIQNENAELRTKVASLTREISELTESRAGEAKKLMDLEARVAQLTTNLRENSDAHTGQITELQESLGQARKFHKWAWDELNKAGVLAVAK